jgi:signal transduction histidine kinase/PAS domain-containing protein
MMTLSSVPSQGMAFIDPALHCVEIDEPCARLFGQAPDAVRGRALGDVLPDLTPLLEPTLRAALRGESPAEVALPDGAARLRCEPVRSRCGVILGVDLLVQAEADGAQPVAEPHPSPMQDEERALLDTLIDSLPFGLAFLDPDLGYVRINRVLAALNGLPVEVHLGRNMRDILPCLAARVEPRVRHVLERGEPIVDDEMLLENPDDPDSPRSFLVSYYPVALPDGQPAGVGVAVIEITERKRAAQQIAELNRRLEQRVAELQTIIDTLPVGVALADDPECRRITINRPAAEMLGIAPGENAAPPAAPDEPPAYRTLCDGRELPPDELPMQQAAARGVRVRDTELEIVRADGSAVDVLMSVSPLLDAQGRPRGAVGALLDITERRRISAQRECLAEAGRRLSGTLDQAALLHTTAQLLIERMADFALVTLLRPDGTTETPVGAHIDPDDAAVLHAFGALYRPDPADPLDPAGVVIRTGQTLLVATLTPGGADSLVQNAVGWELLRRLAPRSLLIVPLVAHGQALGALTLARTRGAPRYTRDDLELAEELAQRAALALDNVQRYAAEQRARREAQAAVAVRDQFLSIASHELKTPLTILLGNAQLLQRRLERHPGLDLRSQQLLRVITGQARRLAQMIQALLEVSHIRQGQFTLVRAPLDLVALVRRVAEETRPGLTQHTLVADFPDGPLVVHGDELRLEQVLQNLISNAVKYSAGGTILLRLRRAGGRARLEVRDQGRGIPAEALPHIFERYYRNPDTNAGAGLGIGLFVVREIVALHGGAVTATSQVGAGSTFTVELPMAS